jgi:DNA-binding IclR family transcriptional regulator
LGIGAGSLAILGAVSLDDAKDVLAYNKTRWGAFNGLTAQKMLKQLKKTRERGFAVHDGSVSGARAIGVALMDASGLPFAGLSVYAATSRMQESRWPELIRILRQHATIIEGAIKKSGNKTRGAAG